MQTNISLSERHLNGDGCWKLLPFLTTNNHNEDEHWLMIRPCFLLNKWWFVKQPSCTWIFKGRWYKSNTNHDTIQWLDYNSWRTTPIDEFCLFHMGGWYQHWLIVAGFNPPFKRLWIYGGQRLKTQGRRKTRGSYGNPKSSERRT